MRDLEKQFMFSMLFVMLMFLAMVFGFGYWCITSDRQRKLCEAEAIADVVTVENVTIKSLESHTMGRFHSKMRYDIVVEKTDGGRISFTINYLPSYLVGDKTTVTFQRRHLVEGNP